MAIVFNYTVIKQYAMKLALQVADSDFNPQYIVALTGDGFVIGHLVSKVLDIPLYGLNVNLKQDMHETNAWMAEDVSNGIPVLVVDAANIDGKTIEWIRNDWNTSIAPRNRGNMADNLKFAVIAQHTDCQVQADYFAHVVDQPIEFSLL